MEGQLLWHLAARAVFAVSDLAGVRYHDIGWCKSEPLKVS
jgi:hypothetical protein